MTSSQNYLVGNFILIEGDHYHIHACITFKIF